MIDSWNGLFVSEKLNLRTVGTVAGFDELLGVALRKNKKRAHLLVSTVLGKHIPQSPKVISFAAEALAAQVFEHAVAVNAGEAFDADYFRGVCVDALLRGMKSGHFERLTASDSDDFLVFGYAETATSLGAYVAEHLNASYIHSTRYPEAEGVEYGQFDESHSHATAHHIAPRDAGFLGDASKKLVLVDDELTTGNTVMNTIRLFQSVTPRESYYIATLTDLRSAEAHAQFKEFEAELGVNVHVVSLVSAELDVPVGSVETAEPIIDEIKQSEESLDLQGVGSVAVERLCEAPVRLSLGVSVAELDEVKFAAEKLAQDVSDRSYGSVLVLGVEEDMYFALKFAEELEALHVAESVKFSSATRSPVVAFNDAGYAIRDRLRYEVEDETRERYAYNIGNDFDQVFVLTNSSDETNYLSGLVDGLTKRTKEVIILEGVQKVKLQEPLSGPEFGSYSEDDVLWLLKDLSNAELEAPTEDREESIQSGGSHYAESLPIEYMPSEEYKELFYESLESSKALIAEAVAFVSEQVYSMKSGNPVLVSLARAGTPVGVLMKRYLRVSHDYEAPHYAVSIVRGKGIDYNALRYLAAHHNPEDVIFVDGWTGKGAITKELSDALDEFHAATGIRFGAELAVLADPGSCVTVYGTREDYLIPSACLNSTVSGLVSRTVLNEDYITADDYHGAKFYAEFSDGDVSNLFVDTVSGEFTSELISAAVAKASTHEASEPDWSGWAMVQQVSEEYGIHNVNLVKPGVGETTRVLLRRVPWRILVRPADKANLKHILLLAEQRGVEVEEREDLPYACIGLIHPQFTKGAVGADGVAV